MNISLCKRQYKSSLSSLVDEILVFTLFNSQTRRLINSALFINVLLLSLATVCIPTSIERFHRLRRQLTALGSTLDYRNHSRPWFSPLLRVIFTTPTKIVDRKDKGIRIRGTCL